MQTYLFYDIETTGLNKAFDQILQFAAIRTDLNLKEIERYELKVKLNPDIIPSPKAVMTHGIGIKEASEGIAEIDAIKKIHQWLNTPGTISLGYNTLGFDDEFLRFSFYRNLLPPYTHQYANRCGRMDIYPMTVMFYLYKNSVLTWPIRDGKISLKLEAINDANQLTKGRAHHAMTDVMATLQLTQLFWQEKEMWNTLLGYFNKEVDQTRLQQLKSTDTLMVDGFFGIEKKFQCPVIALGNHNHYKNQTLWLRLDAENLSLTSPNNIKETTTVIHKKLGEPSFILPLQDQYSTHITRERQTLMESNKTWLNTNSDLFAKIMNYHKDYLYPVDPNTDIDASLYLNGFWTKEEENFCRQFHAASQKEKASLTDKITHPRVKTLALRILGRHYAESMTSVQRDAFTEYLQRTRSEASPFIDFRGAKRLTPHEALHEIDKIKLDPLLTVEKIQLLNELEHYIHLILSEVRI